MSTLFRRAWDALFPIPNVGQLEAFLLRAFLAAVLHRFLLPLPMEEVSQPVPVGLAHFFDLTWLSQPGPYAVYHFMFLVLDLLFAAGWMLPLTLPVLTLLQILPWTLLNSQGHPHHGYQVISLTMLGMSVVAAAQWVKGRAQRLPGLVNSVLVVVLAVAAVPLLGWFMKDGGWCDAMAKVIGAPFGEEGPSFAFSLIRIVAFTLVSWPLAWLVAGKDKAGLPTPILNAGVLMAGQFMIAAAYLVSVCSKMKMSKGRWLLNSHYVALDFVKDTRQSYYSALDPKFAHDPAGVLFFMTHENLARLFFGSGVILETVLIFAVGTRWLAMAFGIMLLVMHNTIEALMTLPFPTNEYMDAFFYMNVPFLIALVLSKRDDRRLLLGRAPVT